MHQIQFRLGLRPRRSHRSPRPLRWILGSPTSKGGIEGKEDGRRKERREGIKGKGKREEKDKLRKGGEERETSPPNKIYGYATDYKK